MNSQEQDPQDAEAMQAPHTPPHVRDANDSRVEELNRRLRKLEETQGGENVRLIAMFVLGISAGISLTLLFTELIREFL